MKMPMNSGKAGWLWGVYALLAVLGTAFVAFGWARGMPHLSFSGGMLVLIAVGGVVQTRALRPSGEGGTASGAERSAWSQIGIGLAAILVLGGLSLGASKSSMASYVLFATYAMVVAFYPMFRRRFAEHDRLLREVPEDERDQAIRAQGDHLSKRLLELALVGLAFLWMSMPGVIHALAGVQVAALVLLPVLAANVAGEARVALLHWRDRQ